MKPDRALGAALAAMLLLLAAYGVGSAPALAARWGSIAGGWVLFAAWFVVAAWVLTHLPRATGRGTWIAVATVAIALRVAAAFLSDGRVSPGDPHWYLVLARGFLAGHGLGVIEPYMGTRAVALFPPAYPLLLAGWGAVAGLSTASLLLLSSLLDVASAGVIVLIARQLGAARAGVAAAGLFLIWPAVLLDAPLAQKESLVTLLALLLAYGWSVTSGRAREVALLGLASAALALTQPGDALLGGLFALLQWRRLGTVQLARAGAMAAGVAALAMLPWWWRNYHLLGAFVPLTSASGYSLWIGNNPAATGTWMPPPAALYGLPELAFSHAAGRIAFEWIAAHPAEAARLTVAKFVRAMGLADAGLVRLAAMRPAVTAPITALLLPLVQGAHVLLLALSSVATFQLRGERATRLLAACFAQLLLLGVWFEFDERHRAFVTPFLLLAVAIAFERVRARGGVRMPRSPLRNPARAPI